MKRYHAIEVIGTGKRQRFVIKIVTRDGYSVGTVPFDGKVYGSAEAAQAAAAAAGVQIAVIGNSYQII